LAAIHALGPSVSINIIGALAPLQPGPLFDLLNRSKKLGWVIQHGDDRFTIGENLPTAVQEKLSEMSTTQRLATLLEKLKELKLEDAVPPLSMSRLLEINGQGLEAGQIRMDLAEQALTQNKLDSAWHHLKRALDCFSKCPDQQSCQAPFVDTVIRLATVSATLMKGFTELSENLQRAIEISTKLGDRRSHALLYLHMGMSPRESRKLKTWAMTTY